MYMSTFFKPKPLLAGQLANTAHQAICCCAGFTTEQRITDSRHYALWSSFPFVFHTLLIAFTFVRSSPAIAKFLKPPGYSHLAVATLLSPLLDMSCMRMHLACRHALGATLRRHALVLQPRGVRPRTRICSIRNDNLHKAIKDSIEKPVEKSSGKTVQESVEKPIEKSVEDSFADIPTQLKDILTMQQVLNSNSSSNSLYEARLRSKMSDQVGKQYCTGPLLAPSVQDLRLLIVAATTLDYTSISHEIYFSPAAVDAMLIITEPERVTARLVEEEVPLKLLKSISSRVQVTNFNNLLAGR